MIVGREVINQLEKSEAKYLGFFYLWENFGYDCQYAYRRYVILTKSEKNQAEYANNLRCCHYTKQHNAIPTKYLKYCRWE